MKHSEEALPHSSCDIVAVNPWTDLSMENIHLPKTATSIERE